MTDPAERTVYTPEESIVKMPGGEAVNATGSPLEAVALSVPVRFGTNVIVEGVMVVNVSD